MDLFLERQRVRQREKMLQTKMMRWETTHDEDFLLFFRRKKNTSSKQTKHVHTNGRKTSCWIFVVVVGNAALRCCAIRVNSFANGTATAAAVAGQCCQCWSVGRCICNECIWMCLCVYELNMNARNSFAFSDWFPNRIKNWKQQQNSDSREQKSVSVWVRWNIYAYYSITYIINAHEIVFPHRLHNFASIRRVLRFLCTFFHSLSIRSFL